MSPRKTQRRSAAPRARSTHGRQRRRLIEACISALHVYGPSRTTVEKVVAIAKMSPGIVRFYFDSKAAMLVASLQFLAAEFEERLLTPVADLKATPVAALERLVDLYLDPDIASPRKVSVWYAFWGEASSRQEYYDICGQKDERFAALVRELIERLIVDASQPQLDADGVALGLIGALEILWQDFAFRTERDIDRTAAKGRCMAYLRSVFPGRFAAPGAGAAPDASHRAPRGPAAVALAPSSYADSRAHALERAQLFPPAWTAVGLESEVARAGEFMVLDSGVERILAIRDAAGVLRALRNCCPQSPHALVMGRGGGGRLESDIECPLHGLRFSWDGRCRHDGGDDLIVLQSACTGGLLFVRAVPARGAAVPALDFGLEVPDSAQLSTLAAPLDVDVRADWKTVVEQWLETVDAPATATVRGPGAGLLWRHDLPGGWSAARYAALVPCRPEQPWRRRFLAPHQVLELRPDGCSVLAALPVAAGRCRVRRLDCTVLAPDEAARAVLYLARRLGPYADPGRLAVSESTQAGRADFAYPEAASLRSPAVRWFREHLLERIPALADL